MLYATLKNKNWGEEDKFRSVPAASSSVDSLQEKIVAFCAEPKSRKEIMEFVGVSRRATFYENYLLPLLSSEKLVMTLPDKPNSPKKNT